MIDAAWLSGLTELVKALGVDPCVFAIVLIVAAFLFYNYINQKHIERMEDLRIKQLNTLSKPKKKP